MSSWENRIIRHADMAPGELRPNPRNWRGHPVQQAGALVGVLRQVGWVQDVIYNQRTGHLVDGHLRVEMALREGAETVPVTVVDLSDEEERLILAALDPLVGMAEADAGLLGELLASVDTQDAALAEMLDGLREGVSQALAALEATARADAGGADAPEAQIDLADELQIKWQTARGQMWRIGKHRLLCGDSLDIESVHRLMAGEVPDMVFADPPYGIEIVATNGYVGGGEAYAIPFGGVKNRRLGTADGSKPFGGAKVRGTVGASHVVAAGKYAPVIGDDSTETAIVSSGLLLAEYPKAMHVWWGGNYYANALPPSSCWLVWDKETTGNFADCELAWTNQKRAARLFRHQWNGMLRESERGRRVHPTQKPVALAVWAFNLFGKEGDIILDPFCGSGMSIAAAEQTGRAARAIEQSEDYVAVILDRMANMGLNPVLEGAHG